MTASDVDYRSVRRAGKLCKFYARGKANEIDLELHAGIPDYRTPTQ